MSDSQKSITTHDYREALASKRNQKFLFSFLESALDYAGGFDRGDKRFIICIQAGVYNENIQIASDLKNIMYTIITGNGSVHEGSITYNLAIVGKKKRGLVIRKKKNLFLVADLDVDDGIGRLEKKMSICEIDRVKKRMGGRNGKREGSFKKGHVIRKKKNIFLVNKEEDVENFDGF
ncbi:hypothetical protein OSB04_000387 [Centaurea solstitialis]|uniref:Pectinesterase catalytic domain-containing protein n=1 Tax=Centaurea solstitialis TaxID=347529 RepID=A0AA38U1M9_9ASTR|nr:hypothetical protein OSB04_000387 [Centaurea solstitialis]